MSDSKAAKRFRLKKDSFYARAGTIYTPENKDPQYFNYNGGMFHERIHYDTIVENPSWWEEVPVEQVGDEKMFIWTDELVLMIVDLAHHNGYHKLKQRCVELFDEVKKQAMGSGYSFSKWITDHLSKQSPSMPSTIDTPKEPLFVTEDGAGIKDGDIVWWVATKEGTDHNTICCDDMWAIGSNEWNEHRPRSGNYKYFSTEPAAKEYVLNHKPCLSVNDIKELWDNGRGFVGTGWLIDKVEAAAKSKHQ